METVAAIRVGVVLALSSAPLYAVAAPIEPQDTQSVTVDFKLQDDYAIVVPAKLGNGRSIQIMVDTGSDETLLDSSLAKQLKLKPGEDVTITLPQGTMTGNRVTVDRFEIGNLAFANQPMLATDLGRLSASLHTAVDLVLGYNVLCSRLDSFQIDYVAKVLLLIRAASGEKDHRCGDHSLPVVSAVIAGQKPLRLLVDTGSKGLMLFGEAHDFSASIIDVPGGRQPNTLPEGFNMKRVQLPDIDFGGGTVVRNPRADLVEPRPPSLSWVDGFLGGGGEFGLSLLKIDTHEQTVRLQFRRQQ
jgi:predicted aspartyl protease